jgi:hypothetical protein
VNIEVIPPQALDESRPPVSHGLAFLVFKLESPRGARVNLAGLSVFLEIIRAGVAVNAVARTDDSGRALFKVQCEQEAIDELVLELWFDKDNQIILSTDPGLIRFNQEPSTFTFPLSLPRPDVTAYRVQGGSGHESVGFLVHDERSRQTSINPAFMPSAQLNISVGDSLHARYFCEVVQKRLGEVFLFDIDGDFFHRWLAPAAMPQLRHAQSGNQWQPPEAGSCRSTDIIIEHLERLLREGRLLTDEEFEKWKEAHPLTEQEKKASNLRQVYLAKLAAEGLYLRESLGPVWKTGLYADKGKRQLRAIESPKVGDTKQPSYKLELVAPWPLLLNLFIKNGQPAVSYTGIMGPVFDPPQVRKTPLLQQELGVLLDVVRNELKILEGGSRAKGQTQGRKRALPGDTHNQVQQYRGYVRTLEKLGKVLAESPPTAEDSNDRYDDGIFGIFNEVGRIWRSVCPSELWWPRYS